MFDHISSLDTYYELDITERTIPQNTENWASPALEGTQKKKKKRQNIDMNCIYWIPGVRPWAWWWETLSTFVMNECRG